MPPEIEVTFRLSPTEATALAQFLKRVSFDTCKKHSDPTNHDEPWLMQDGLSAVRRGLDEAGYSPR